MLVSPTYQLCPVKHSLPVKETPSYLFQPFISKGFLSICIYLFLKEDNQSSQS